LSVVQNTSVFALVQPERSTLARILPIRVVVLDDGIGAYLTLESDLWRVGVRQVQLCTFMKLTLMKKGFPDFAARSR